MPNNVTFELSEYKESLSDWVLMDDVCSGEKAIKKAKEKYLPKPNPSDKSKENKDRYDNYLKRAVFYNVTGRTAHGLTGASFKKAPEMELPARLSYIEKNVDGIGNGLLQQVRKAVFSVLKNGRFGVFIDVSADGGQPRAVTYSAKSIINWQVKVVNDEKVYSRIVLKETVQEITPDGFGTASIDQWRELFLDERGYFGVRLWRKSSEDNTKDEYVVVDQFQPTTERREHLDRIPFVFIGSVNNDAEIDPIPLFDLAIVNLAHYRNSADYEHSAYMVGQAQPWISGLSEEWRDYLEEHKIYFGSGSVIPLPQGGAMGIEQVSENGIAKEAMDTKEKQMIGLGARVVERGSGSNTATQERNENEVEHSVLSLAVQNVSSAYVMVIGFMAKYKAIETNIQFELSTDFNDYKPEPQLLNAINQTYQTGKLPDIDYWKILKKYGVINADRDIDAIRDEVDSNSPDLDLD